MTKEQALQKFWEGFGLTAYDENTVPDKAELPYLTYEVSTGSIGDTISLSASLWYYGNSWKSVTEKAEEISINIGLGGRMVAYDEGAIWIQRGTPFSQRMADDTNKSVRRIVLNVQAEFISV